MSLGGSGLSVSINEIKCSADGTMTPRSVAPIWLMGLTNSVFGMYGGIVAISVPQLLSMRHVPETAIAGMSAIIISPGFWAFLVSPVLDVRFSRRWYSVVTAAMAAALLVVALLNLDHLALVTGLLVAGFFSANLYQSALGGWLSSITSPEQENKLSSWVTIGNLGAGGAMAVATGELVRDVSPGIAALVLGGLVLLPTAVFPFMPAPEPDRRLAAESFSQFFGDVLSLLKRREVLIAIVLFIAPAGAFSLTNFLGGIGNDFHASPHFVSLVGGGGVVLGATAGCLLFRLIDRLLPLRFLYLAVGVVGSLFTLLLILLPRTPEVFGAAFIGENVFQGLAITISIAIIFETVGRRNPLAATIFCFLISAYNIPLTYMLFVDGWGYGKQGVAGGFAADASLGIVASVLLGALLIWVAPRRPAVFPAA
jgi:MFS transporter, PAT family, beta-lactamase induction signal transducer AmpG